jgi:hypothetical protein
MKMGAFFQNQVVAGQLWGLWHLVFDDAKDWQNNTTCK